MLQPTDTCAHRHTPHIPHHITPHHTTTPSPHRTTTPPHHHHHTPHTTPHFLPISVVFLMIRLKINDGFFRQVFQVSSLSHVKDRGLSTRAWEQDPRTKEGNKRARYPIQKNGGPDRKYQHKVPVSCNRNECKKNLLTSVYRRTCLMMRAFGEIPDPRVFFLNMLWRGSSFLHFCSETSLSSNSVHTWVRGHKNPSDASAPRCFGPTGDAGATKHSSLGELMVITSVTRSSFCSWRRVTEYCDTASHHADSCWGHNL